MPSFFNLILIFLHIYILVIFLSLSGYLFRKGFINHKYKQRFEEDGLYGFILIGFVSVLQNFFVPLNLIYNSIILIKHSQVSHDEVIMISGLGNHGHLIKIP